ncbi:MAG: ABC transporter substrate-binding protein [Deltaproteobacteria bacterium]|nr:ABC transporter substrate-binding protein [Deltaproteobacteria bacterium]
MVSDQSSVFATNVQQKIGIAGNFSGGSDSTNNQWNKYIYPAALLAMEDFLRRRPEYGEYLQFLLLDYGGKKERVLSTTQRAEAEHVLAVVGYDQSEFAEIAARALEELRIPMITHTATADRITAEREYIFRVCFTNSVAAKELARFARHRLNVETVISLPISTCLYCTDLHNDFGRHFAAFGGRVIDQRSDIRDLYTTP